MDVYTKPKQSSALWLPLVWVVFLASKALSIWLYSLGIVDYTYFDIEEGSFIDRTFYICLIIAGIYVLVNRRQSLYNIYSENFWLFLLLLYAAISIAWSDIPYVAIKRFIKEIGNIVMVLVILTDPNPLEAIRSILKKCSCILIPLSCILIKYFPTIGRVYHKTTGKLMPIGVTTQKNGLGMLCLLSGMYIVWFITDRNNLKTKSSSLTDMSIHLVLLVMVLWLLQIANSSTSTICFIVGSILLITLSLPAVRNYPYAVNLIILITLIIFGIAEYLFELSNIILLVFEKDSTLTDRTVLWKDCIALIQNPFIGTGYDSFWSGKRLIVLWDNWWWQPNQSHNGYVETYLNLGLFGLVILACFIISTWKNIAVAYTNIANDFSRYQYATFFVALFYNWSEASFRGLSAMWFLLLMVSVRVTTSNSEKC